MADATPTTSQTITYGFAPEVAPYAQSLMGAAMGQTFALNDAGKITGFQPYQQYQGERFAQFTPLQQQAFTGAQQMTSAPQLGQASALAGQAGLSALGTGYTPGSFTTPLTSAAQLQQYQLGPAQQVGTRSFTDQGVAQQYMNPYLSSVQQQLQRQADIQRQSAGAQAARAGAFGGARAGLANQQINAELMRQQQQAQAGAYGQAQQQFNVEQQAALQAALANQQAGLTTGQQNLAAALGVQQLGAQQDVQTQLANQQSQLQAQQLAEQSRQYGAGLGLQGLQTGLQAAQQLGALGQTQFGQEQAINQLQAQYGAQQQQQMQNILGAQYQDFLNYQNYPYKQLGFFSDILRGVPLTQTGSSVYQAAPTAVQTMTGLGLGAAGISSLLKKDGGTVSSYARGGAVKGYDDGGSVMSPGFKRYAVDHIDPRALPIAQRNAMARGDVDTVQAAIAEMAQDAALRRGLPAAMPPGADVVRAAGGGILAFADKGEVDSSEGDDSEGVSNIPQALQDLFASGEGDPATFKRLAAMYPSIVKELYGFQPKTMSDTDRKKFTADYISQFKDEEGEDPYGPMKRQLAEFEQERAGTLGQAKGTALLRAAAAAVQPGGTIRGLTGAASAFGESYGQALQADRAERRSLANMQFNLADAQRKERMGMRREALTALSQAERDQALANTARFNRLKAIGELTAKGMQASKPGTPRAPGQGPDVFRQLAAAKVEYTKNPTPELAKQIEALTSVAELQRKSDIGPVKAAGAADVVQARIDKEVSAAMEDWKLMTPAYREAARTDPALAAKMESKQEKVFRDRFSTPGAAVPSPTPTKAPPPPPGFQVQ